MFLVLGVLATMPFVTAMGDYQDALAAQQRGDYRSAAQAWQQLASTGDPVAQYNLGVLYANGQGVRSDVAAAQVWFTKAARQGLTEAYHRLNAKSVQPSQNQAKPVQAVQPQASVAVVPVGQDWLVALQTGKYTVQLVSSTDEDMIKEYLQLPALRGRAGYFRNRRQGQEWYTLVFGTFPTVAQANAAIAELPDDLKKWSPWVRNVTDVQRMMR